MALLQRSEEGVMMLTLNRPEALNALTTQLLLDLAKALEDAQASSVRTVVITGAGRAFCVGQDLGEVQGQEISYKDHLQHYALVVERIRDLDKPVLAAVNGVAAGAGVSLAQEEVLALARQLAQGPTKALGLLKQALNKSATATLKEMLECEASFQEIAGRSRDHAEGMRAFLEKRTPTFTGE
jgi:enoyl-CoA hydratase/carnithine racemase